MASLAGVQKRRRIGAYGVVRDQLGRVLLVRSSGRANLPGEWCLPGGGLDHGEDPAAGLIREFAEETGLAVRPAALRQVTMDLLEFPWRGVLLHHDRVIFDVEIIGGELAGELGGSSDLPEWVAPDRLSELPLAPFTARTLGVPEVPFLPGHPPEHPDDNGEFAANGWSLAGAKQVTRFAAYGVVTDPAGRVLLSLIADGYPGAGHWHLPGGGTDFGEFPQQGLVREIAEESGQHSVVRELLRVGSKQVPNALGPEREPLDWYTVRVVFRVTVSEPTEPRVTEAAGGSTAQARWFARSELSDLALSDLARRELLHID